MTPSGKGKYRRMDIMKRRELLPINSKEFSGKTVDTFKKYLKKLNLWLIAPKGATPVNQTSAIARQMALRQVNVVCIKLQV